MMNLLEDVPAARGCDSIKPFVMLGLLVICVIGFIRTTMDLRALEATLSPAQLRPIELPMSYREATAHQFRIRVADQAAEPEQRNANLHEASDLLDDPDRIAAIGSLGAGETDGYDTHLRKIAHTFVPAAGWYTTHPGLRTAMLRICRGHVYDDDECYAAYLGALIAHGVPKGYVANTVLVIPTNPLPMLVNVVRSLPSQFGG